MSYQVLARKWRPHNFTEVVGQAHVVKSLLNALQHNRLHHAYLFTGTRGVGKTTLARILAKAVNCENLQDFNPCGTCSVCVAVDEGRFLDLIEVDAASRTKVEDTRELLDNAQYAPNQGRYKVYLIDEVHMLSGHSFNALLKTLEEPPPHVKFLLATTDPQKIPVTVLSRCLQLNLKRLQPNQIFAQMGFILAQEGIESEPAALKTLARAADGSMRDGLSLLDQAIVFGDGKVTAAEVNAMLGCVAEQPVEALLSALALADAEAIFAKIDEIADLSADFGGVLQSLLQILHHIALYQYVPNALESDFAAETIINLAAQFSPEDVQLFYQIGLLGQKDLALAPDPRSGFEMLMLRMLTFKPAQAVAQQKSQSAATFARQTLAEAKTSQQKTSASMQPDLKTPIVPQRETDWTQMIATMKLESVTKQLANNCVLEQLDDKVCVLLLDAPHQSLLTAMRLEKLQKALQTHCGKPIKLTINIGKAVSDTPAVQLGRQREGRQQSAIDEINLDATVQALIEQFDARILPGTIEPIEGDLK